MLNRLMGEGTSASLLKTGLASSMERARQISGRVANAGNGGPGGFAEALDAAQAGGAARVDLEAEMVALADEQLRYEAAAKLLQKVYAGLRSAVKER